MALALGILSVPIVPAQAATVYTATQLTHDDPPKEYGLRSHYGSVGDDFVSADASGNLYLYHNGSLSKIVSADASSRVNGVVIEGQNVFYILAVHDASTVNNVFVDNVYRYNISTETTDQITFDVGPYSSKNGLIADGGKVIWYNETHVGVPPNDSYSHNIWLYDEASNAVSQFTYDGNSNPIFVKGSLFLWRSSNSCGVHEEDFATGASTVLPIDCGAADIQIGDDGRIVWTVGTSSTTTVLKEFDGSTISQIDQTPIVNAAMYPQLVGNVVVWQNYEQSVQQTPYVKIRNLVTGQSQQIPSALSAHTDGNLVVWRELAMVNGSAKFSPKFKNLATGQTGYLYQQDNSNVWNVAFGTNFIVWTTHGQIMIAQASEVSDDITAPIVQGFGLEPNPIEIGHDTELTVTAHDPMISGEFTSGLAVGEYFVGSDDPGQGNGLPLTLNGGTFGATFGSDLTPGTYLVNVRMKDVAGNWSAITSDTLAVNAPVPPQVPLSFQALGSASSSVKNNSNVSSFISGNAAVGDTVMVSVMAGSSAGAVGCSDSKGNLYQVVADKNTSDGRLFICSAAVTSALGAGDDVTATYPSFKGLSVMSVSDVSGLDIPGIADGVITASGNGVAVHSGLITPSNVQAVVFGAVAHSGKTNFLPAGEYTMLGEVSDGNGANTKTVTPVYQVVNSASSYAVSGALSKKGSWRRRLLCFLPPVVATGARRPSKNFR